MNKIKFLSVALATSAALVSCSDEFLEEKMDYNYASDEIYQYETGVNGRLANIYNVCQPTTASSDYDAKRPSYGNADDFSKSTEEYSGFGDWVDPEIELTTGGDNQVPDYIMIQSNSITVNVYGRIRNINNFLEKIQDSQLDDEFLDAAKGQAYFWRAWCYYNLFKWYGGVPLVEDVQEPEENSYTPRSSAKATLDFILNDLDTAARLLANKTMNGGWASADDWGRVTTGTALALKGRALLLWASPLFNRSNDASRWQRAYNEMSAEKDSIDACGYGLYTASGTDTDAKSFAAMFSQGSTNPEAVLVTLYNNVSGNLSGAASDVQRNNTWEKAIRPSNTGGSGLNPSAMLIDMFPMRDGKKPSTVTTYSLLEASQYEYNDSFPFVDRDPRFYRTFAFPGFRWAYNGDASVISSNNPSDGSNYTLWNYVWYTDLNDQGNVESGNAYGADNLLSNVKGVYVRKKTDDKDVNSSSLYVYDGTATGGAGPYFSGAQLLELRYAEVLLNLAEAACMTGNLDEAVGYIQQIRARVGYTAENNYGLQANVASDQSTCMSAILYERQIEFAYEGKRFDDMRRWMLFDGGAEKPEGTPSTWTLSGWGGNTCTWLGFTPFNGQRRENMRFRVQDSYGVGGTAYGSDPIVDVAGETRPEGVNLNASTVDEDIASLTTWYRSHLQRQLNRGDARDADDSSILYYCNYRPQYYIIGLKASVQTNNPKLEQTVGWEDYNTGTMGTFDPLAE